MREPAKYYLVDFFLVSMFLVFDVMATCSVQVLVRLFGKPGTFSGFSHHCQRGATDPEY